MIDTDKYEGHTEGPWRVENGNIHAEADWWSGAGDMIFFSKRHNQDANSQLIADAPLLLAEVKRLRSTIEILAADYDSLILDLGRASTGDLDIEEVYEKHLMGVNDE